MEDQATRFEKRSWKVPEELDDIRLDSFARQCLPQLSRREIETAVGARLFLINGKVGRKGDRLCAGAVLVFIGPKQWLAEHPLPDSHFDISILYEDPSVLLVNKPAGVATHGFSGRDTDTLANFLLAKRPNLVNVGKSRWEPGLVHRLDRETSGLVLIAKTESAFEQLRAQFRRRQIQKIYRALVWGVAPCQGVIDFPLAHARDKRRMRVVRQLRQKSTQRAWTAVTRYRRLGQSQNLSWLELEMTTGVTHQIRVHLAAVGHPIVGDSLYGAHATETFGLRRHFLHASGLEFRHPDDGRIIRLEAELPSELREVLGNLQMKF
jgi:23S rRNA pseudouridine1911/1915/1917 synthase